MRLGWVSKSSKVFLGFVSIFLLIALPASAFLYLPQSAIFLDADNLAPSSYVPELEQDLSWGVLAINTDKSVYAPGERGDISIAVLDHEGNMSCDASVTLEVTNRNTGITDTLTTENGQIKVNPECLEKAYTTRPDFEANVTFADSGTYELKLSATTERGEKTITDYVTVTDRETPFTIKREGPTRIFPIANYPMRLTITATDDYAGVI